MRNIFLILLLFLCLLDNKIKAQSHFVSASGYQFLLNNKPYYYIGTNYWYGGLLALQKDKKRGIERLKKELDFLQFEHIKNLRVLVGAEGSGFVNGVERVGPPLQPEKGKFNEAILESLDVLLNEMSKRNMKAILFLSNNWEWSGGFLQYLRWNGLIADSVFRRKLSWDEMRDYVSKFYTCEACKKDYLKQVTFILNHTNKLTGKKYTEEPAIMAWELANEPRPMRPTANQTYQKWISDVAAFIKARDKNHLVTTGMEGEIGTENLSLFEKVYADKNIDYLTIHIWPKNWGWFKPETMEADFPNVITKTNDYINKHVAIAQKLNKPLVIEEFGLPRDNHSYDTASTTTLRNKYYDEIFRHWKKDVIPGVNFWAFNGVARPIKGQVFWKKGDDYMGDPPMEEQGLNGVFDSDKETWYKIAAYSFLSEHIAQNIPEQLEAIPFPTDKKATKETVNLTKNLKKLLNKGIMFGHQDDLAYGVGWKYEPGRSDIKDVTGDYPAVYGFELGRLEIDQPVNLDSVPFDKMKEFIRSAYNRGGVITLSWHLNNPLTGKTAWDPAAGTVSSILPGGEKNELYKNWLDKVAAFMLDLKGKHGEYIPIIFRPFHELNGNWFWWGKNHCTPDELRRLWHFTVSYLRDKKDVHNLLYAFNTDRFYFKEEYLERYPGDEWVDIIGLDIYQRGTGGKANEQFVMEIDKMLSILEDIAKERDKIPALTEFGFGKLPDSTWWTNVFWKGIQSHKISYVLGWRNAGYEGGNNYEYYVPYKGHASAPDFLKLFNEEKTLFQNDVAKEKLYQ
ncbi:MAG TPA: glycosyl hydrolase [Chitinophagaceae bacterium]|jgi:mannan endo-1,4-beta-mannosidase|nr:glycosyl hydrolase [Chitinophagaceae bacterium]